MHSSIQNQLLTSTYFVCPKTFTVIALRRLNDGYLDCLYGEDEKNSDFTMTRPYRYRCQTASTKNQYVSYQQLGNGINECDDGSDEISQYQNWEILKCHSPQDHACWVLQGDGIHVDRIKDIRIPFNHYCDSIWHTMHGEDERNCSQWVCALNMYRCNGTGQCIPPDYIRDGTFDCDDGEDELNYSAPAKEWTLENMCNKSIEYFCITAQYLQDQSTNRPCIARKRIGDGIIDCIGGRDERNVIGCHDNMMLGNRFQCDNQSKCIHHSALCDGFSDCIDHTDETICAWNQSTCPVGNFLCADKRGCIVVRCQNRENCKDNSQWFWCPDANVVENYRWEKHIDSNLRVRMCCKDIALKLVYGAAPKPPVLAPIGSLVQTRSFTYCHRGFYVTTQRNTTRICFCPPSYYGSRCQFESRRLTTQLYLDRNHRSDISVLVTILVLLIYNKTEIIDHKHYTDMRDDFSPKVKVYLTFPRPKLVGFYSVRCEAYDATQFMTAWEYPVSPFDFLPVFRLAKILRLPDRSLPWLCNVNECHNGGTCYIIHDNQHLCLCKHGWQGPHCQEKMSPVKCAPHSLARNQEICICPSGYQVPHCFIRNTACESASNCPVGTHCIPFSTLPPNRFRCVCSSTHCNNESSILTLHRRTPNQLPFVLQLLDTSSHYPTVRNQILIPQSTHFPSERPISLFGFQRIKFAAPQMGLIFTFQIQSSTVDAILHIMYINCSTSQLKFTIDLDMIPQRCLSVDSDEYYLIKQFHLYCQQSLETNCFYSQHYLCYCNTRNVNRSECIPYVQQKLSCDYCLHQGYCATGDLHNKSDFTCICPTCASGQLCQYSPKRFLISLELLIEKTDRIIYHFVGSISFVIVGMIFNGLSLLTFLNPECRQTGSGKYLLINTITSQLLIIFLLLRIIYHHITRRIMISAELNEILCKSLPLIMSFLKYLSLWLMACVTFERALIALYPAQFHTIRKPKIAWISLIILSTLILISIMTLTDQYKLVTYPGNLYPWCIIEDIASREKMVRYTTLVHHIVPFLLNFFSGLIIIRAISHSKARSHRKSKRRTLARETRERVNLLLGPSICFMTQLPQLIILFMDPCIFQQSFWFLLSTVVTYYISFIPHVIVLFLYVCPSPVFRKVLETKINLIYRLVAMVRS
jgi:hypothetical protein